MTTTALHVDHTPSPAGSPSGAPTRVAPVSHTVVLVVVFLVVALAGASMQHGMAAAATSTAPRSQIPLYLSAIIMEWGLVYYVWRVGLTRTNVPLRELIGGRWRSWRDVVIDVLWGAAAWGVWAAFSAVVARRNGAHTAATVSAMLPQRPLEIALWVLVSLSAGFSEELVFRGYFQRQFHALSGSATLALLAQAVLFGVSHGYQGLRSCLTITCYGVLFGLVARQRSSLRPGMMAHAWTDIAAGIFRI